MARPSTYNKDKHVQIARLCALAGFTDEEIAEELGIDVRTLYRWKVSHDELSQALKENKDIVDSRVEATLYKKATGYTEQDVKIFQFQGEEVIVPYTKKHEPDTTALIFWLKNRQPKKWRDTKNIDLDGNDLNITIEVNGK